MRRREFVSVLGGCCMADSGAGAADRWIAADRRADGVCRKRPGRASQARRISGGSPELGWAEDRNIRMDTRWPIPGDKESMQRLAKELVALQPDLILSHITLTTAALLQQTRTIPIIFATVTDPVGSGFVASFPRPGGNVTGFTSIEPTLPGKWLELLKEIAPRVTRATVLFNPVTAPYIGDFFLKPLKAAALSSGVEVIVAPIRDMSDHTHSCCTGP